MGNGLDGWMVYYDVRYVGVQQTDWLCSPAVFPMSIQFGYMECTLIYDVLLSEYEVSSHMQFQMHVQKPLIIGIRIF